MRAGEVFMVSILVFIFVIANSYIFLGLTGKMEVTVNKDYYARYERAKEKIDLLEERVEFLEEVKMPQQRIYVDTIAMFAAGAYLVFAWSVNNDTKKERKKIEELKAKRRKRK